MAMPPLPPEPPGLLLRRWRPAAHPSIRPAPPRPRTRRRRRRPHQRPARRPAAPHPRPPRLRPRRRPDRPALPPVARALDPPPRARPPRGRIEPGSLDAVLADVVARFGPQARPQPPLSLVDVRRHQVFSSAQIASLFNAAAALQPANLVVCVTASRPGVVGLPRLDRTKSVALGLPHGVHLVLPQEPDVDLPALESLSLGRYDDMVTLRLDRFSALRSLAVSDWRRDSIVISLPFLEELVLVANVQLRRVCITAPRLNKLAFHARAGVPGNFSLQYLAPKVEDLSWQCAVCTNYYGYASHVIVTFGHIWTLMMVTIKTSEPQGKLQHTPGSNMYTLSLDISERQVSNGSAPAWGLYLDKETEGGPAYTSGVRGEDYDIDMLKVILRSAAMLERVAFTISLKSEQRIRRFSRKIHSILKAHPSVECKIYRCSGELVLSA
ncbi:hypothetical protein HU200_010220 [Digitaria exilis]|uniref:Uncharacterized protein n=1 Tax=Digitaria exilis TaxID=1010633 RepID=A0A835FHT4_9POAL|nr:hypothetical protein HU200_010220 [Digitaria exilis]